LRVWQLDDVSRSLPQSTLISRYNEQQRSRSSSSSRHILRSLPDRRYTALVLCLKKVKGKDTDPDIAFYMRQAHSLTLAIKQQIYM